MSLCMFLHATEYYSELESFQPAGEGYAVDVQNIASPNENDQAQHCMVYKAD